MKTIIICFGIFFVATSAFARLESLKGFAYRDSSGWLLYCTDTGKTQPQETFRLKLGKKDEKKLKNVKEKVFIRADGAFVPCEGKLRCLEAATIKPERLDPLNGRAKADQELLKKIK